MSPKLLGQTESVCPVCLKILPAEIWERGAEVFLERSCPEHGFFAAAIWRGEPNFRAWRRPRQPRSIQAQTPRERGCPRDCGLCPDHGQKTCAALLEVTDQCDLSCPVCFADSGGPGASSRPLGELIKALHWIQANAGQVVLQLSGGEPTRHPELLELVAAAKKLFPAVQLNTNGLRLANEPALAEKLAKNGLNWVFLQFDSLTDPVYRVLRGRPLQAQKVAAVAACQKAHLPVILVPTVVKGLNDQELGQIVDWAKAQPIVRGVHIQPMTQAGRNNLTDPERRLTIPEILQALETGTEGRIQAKDARPPGCEHERCSFHFRFRRQADGALTPWVPQAPLSQLVPRSLESEGLKMGPTVAPQVELTVDDAALNQQKAVEILIHSWGPGEPSPAPPHPGPTIPMARKKAPSLDDFLAQARRETFSVTGMAFQDGQTLDLQRLKSCCVHVYQEPGRLIPFCAMNLTSTTGQTLHRKRPC